MIVREDPGGGLVMVSQLEHSRFVGLLAAHWGNDEVEPPEPYESVVRAAATYHDFGYLDAEPVPTVEPFSGRPHDFRSRPFVARQLDAYQWLIDWLSELDRNAGLLASRHRTGLWQGRYGVVNEPAAGPARPMAPEIAAFVEKNEAVQARSGVLADPGFQRSFLLLQIWDLLGLYFGCQEPTKHAIAPLPLRASPQARMTMTPLGHAQVRFEPYPFDVRPLRVGMVARRLDTASFADDAALRRHYACAVPELLEYELV